VGLVKVESSEGITTITMTRGDKRNALSQALCDDLYEAYRGFEAGSDHVAVLQADGPAFCVGADLKDPPGAMWKAVPHVSHAPDQAGDLRDPGLGDRRRHLHGDDLRSHGVGRQHQVHVP